MMTGSSLFVLRDLLDGIIRCLAKCDPTNFDELRAELTSAMARAVRTPPTIRSWATGLFGNVSLIVRKTIEESKLNKQKPEIPFNSASSYADTFE
jgi:hypothetical protein